MEKAEPLLEVILFLPGMFHYKGTSILALKDSFVRIIQIKLVYATYLEH